MHIKISVSFKFCFFNPVSKRKDFKSTYFALIGLKEESPFNFTLKHMYNMLLFKLYLFEKMSSR